MPKPATQPADERRSPSDLPVAVVYRPDRRLSEYAAELADPGRSRSTAACSRACTEAPLDDAPVRGFGTAGETNTRFKLPARGRADRALVAFDLPTQMGIDSDSPARLGEVGRVGVAIDTVEDMHALLADLPLERVSTSMTINATASVLLAMYVVVAEERGIARAGLSGTVQNDVLKEYIARGTYIYPPEPSLSLIAEMFRFCAAEVPQWNPISISATTSARPGDGGAGGRLHLRRTRWSTCAVRRGRAAGRRLRAALSFFFAAHNDLFEEVAKFRARAARTRG
jgi:methylmalonyl-CoA mutase N-terminal domain/subunit